MEKKAVILVFWLAAGMLFPEAETLHYRITSPLMGTLGTITIDKKVGKKSYRIDAGVRTQGIASMLTGKRREHYRSEGSMEGGLLKSHHLRLERRSSKKRQIDDYRFDPTHRKVLKSRVRWKKEHLDQNNSKTLPYFTREDILTLYFNNIGKILRSPEKRHWEILAVGAEKIKGKIVIDRLEGEPAKEAREDLDVKPGTPVLVFYSPQKIAGKRNRRFTVAVDDYGLPLRIRFVAIPVVGEIFVERK
jgi:hypothetical protein